METITKIGEDIIEVKTENTFKLSKKVLQTRKAQLEKELTAINNYLTKFS